MHTFTHAHTPDRFIGGPVLGLIVYTLVQWGPTRRLIIAVLRLLDPQRQTALGRYAEILQTSYKSGQDAVFELVRGFYPEGTRFVVLPMDMTYMNAGRVHVDIASQHQELTRVRSSLANSDGTPAEILCLFAAVDPRHKDIVATTKRLIEEDRFCGIKLYPPTGYHPNDPALTELYRYAAANDVPVLTHCSRPAQVQFRGKPTPQMRIDPDTGQHLNLGREELLTHFTSPDAYRKLMNTHKNLRVCLAHFGGGGDWSMYLQHPWGAPAHPTSRLRNLMARFSDGPTPGSPEESWLPKILEMIRSGDYPNLWTDISYTLYNDDEYVYLLKVLLSDQRILKRVLFGSDFYVVENAPLEERRRSVRIRGVLGEAVFRRIAEQNPREFLGSRCP
jgi:hypothetical protein